MSRPRNTQGRYCGRQFSRQELELVARLCSELPNRKAVAMAMCEQLDWRSPNGNIKEMSARVAMLRMERDGLIQQPPPLHPYGNGRRRWPLRLPPPPQPPPLECSLQELGPLEVVPVTTKALSSSWIDLMASYHYIGYAPLAGAQRRYFVHAQGRPLCLFGFGASAWKCRPRDEFIGWSDQARQANLRLIVNNSRFLILPWVRVPNLASRALALVTRQLPHDWQMIYCYRPVMLETFVELDRFSATSYRAANWIPVGRTQGRGKLDVHKLRALPVKNVLCLPLTPDFRRHLNS